jgi:hypothetical protein
VIYIACSCSLICFRVDVAKKYAFAKADKTPREESEIHKIIFDDHFICEKGKDNQSLIKMEKNFGPAEESDCFEGAQFGRQ